MADKCAYAVHLKFFGLPKLWPYVRKYKGDIIRMALYNLAVCGIMILRPLVQRYALNHFVGEGTLDTLPQFIVLFVAGIALMTFCNYKTISLSLSNEMRILRDLRDKAFEHLQTLSFSYFNQNSVGYIHSRVMSDTSRIGDLFAWQVNDTAYFTVYIIGAVAVMLSINPRLTAMIMIIIPAVGIIWSFFQKKLIRLNREIREINAAITGNFNEGITGAKTIKSLVIEDIIDKDFVDTTQRMRAKSVETAKHRGIFGAFSTFATSLALAIILWKGGVIAKSEVGTFSMFMSYAQELMEPVRWLIDTVAVFVQGQVNIERYTRLMETEPNVKDSEEIIAIYGDVFEPRKENWEDIKGDIEFRHVDFKYPDGDEYILKDFNLKIPFGTNLAIVGETGAGKSTLANLICRFYEPTAGQVLIDGRDSRERSQLWLHSALGYVLQTPHLFSGTIKDNLLYGNVNATDEEIDRAIDLVSARAVIDKLDDGLMTDVGEGGDLLSTGEKQLISFARAILADPKIIVLDEATASVDTITEQKIQAAIDTIIKGRTSIVIAHRLSTIRHADIILVVHEGKIVEQGRHEELLARKGVYWDLWTRQYEDEVTGAFFKELSGEDNN
jgi:ATP-binding cassette subfamily B protein